jgi:CelD/BcsL family acetyltransferase involved in cellulose biosynthesis
VAEWAAGQGWLRLWFLRLDGTPIAFAYGLEHDGVYFSLKVGFDPGYARFGPGIVLMQDRIRHAFTSP